MQVSRRGAPLATWCRAPLKSAVARRASSGLEGVPVGSSRWTSSLSQEHLRVHLFATFGTTRVRECGQRGASASNASKTAQRRRRCASILCDPGDQGGRKAAFRRSACRDGSRTGSQRRKLPVGRYPPERNGRSWGQVYCRVAPRNSVTGCLIKDVTHEAVDEPRDGLSRR